MEKDTITSIFNKLEILNFFLSQDEFKQSREKVSEQTQLNTEGKKKSAVLVIGVDLDKEEVNADKNCLQSRALHFHTDKYKHTLVYKGTRDAFLVRKLQG